MSNLKKKIGTLIQGATLFFITSVAQAGFVNLDFSGTGGTLDDGTTYSLAGGYSQLGSGFSISDQTLVVTFSNSVNFNIETNSSAGGPWNNIADGTIQFGVVSGSLSVVSDPDNEISTVTGDNTANLAIDFRYEGSGPTGPNGNDFIAANQDWLIAGTTASTLTIIHNPNQPNGSAFQIAAEGSAVPAPATLWIFGLGLIAAARARRRF